MMLVIALLFTADIFLVQANVETSKIYIVHMGERQHDDVELITSSHHDLLASVLGSREAAVSSMVYSYRHGFSGFAAKLTKRQAQIFAELPGVVDVIPNRIYKFHTTRSWDYLGVSSAPTVNRYKKLQTNWDYLGLSSNSLPNAKLPEEDVIIGVIDSGVWPESASFEDRGLGPIPLKWKGSCEGGEYFDPQTNCNRKLIGARFFYKGVEDEIGKHPFNASEYNDYLSARDATGHGTHAASIAAGSFVHNVSVEGLANGTARGGAPGARLAIYKVGWGGQLMASADVCKAFDEAIHDGVDVLSVSLGSGIIPVSPETDKKDLIYYGSFHAVAKAGITVVCAAGNSGPVAQTLENIAPWVITVAATTIDRSFPTSIMLGDLTNLTGQAMFYGKDTGFVGLTFNEFGDQPPPCEYLSSSSDHTSDMSGKVVLCFTITSDSQLLVQKINNFSKLEPKPLGIIIAGNPIRTRDIHSFAEATPRILVSYDVGTRILNYIHSSRESSKEPKVRIQPSRTYNGVSTYVSGFSSRGPNPLSPSILKPDIAAPGADILAAVFDGYGFKSGTSMATPHVSGIVALLKSLHPDWSPAAIRSALVTTAWTNDPYSEEPIFSEGDVTRIANPFDFGGGLVNYNRAKDPGLVYDLGIEEYTDYLCSMGYNRGDIKDFTGKSCPEGKITSVLDLNLPSITIPNLNMTPVNVTRTVTNVGADPNSKYKAIIEPPDGVTVIVNPDNLIFTPEINKIPFTVSIATTHQVTTKYYFGSLTWTDGYLHNVTIPISVRSEFPIN